MLHVVSDEIKGRGTKRRRGGSAEDARFAQLLHSLNQQLANVGAATRREPVDLVPSLAQAGRLDNPQKSESSDKNRQSPLTYFATRPWCPLIPLRRAKTACTTPLLDVLEAVPVLTGFLPDVWAIVIEYSPLSTLILVRTVRCKFEDDDTPSVLRYFSPKDDVGDEQPANGDMGEVWPIRSEDKTTDVQPIEMRIEDPSAYHLVLVDPCAASPVAWWSFQTFGGPRYIGSQSEIESTELAIPTSVSVDGGWCAVRRCDNGDPSGTSQLVVRKLADGRSSHDPETFGAGIEVHGETVQCWFCEHKPEPNGCVSCDYHGSEDAPHLVVADTSQKHGFIRVVTPYVRYNDDGTLDSTTIVSDLSCRLVDSLTKIAHHPTEPHIFFLISRSEDGYRLILQSWSVHSGRMIWKRSISPKRKDDRSSSSSSSSSSVDSKESGSKPCGTEATAPVWMVVSPAIGTVYQSRGGVLWVLVAFGQGRDRALMAYTVDNGEFLGQNANYEYHGDEPGQPLADGRVIVLTKWCIGPEFARNKMTYGLLVAVVSSSGGSVQMAPAQTEHGEILLSDDWQRTLCLQRPLLSHGMSTITYAKTNRSNHDYGELYPLSVVSLERGSNVFRRLVTVDGKPWRDTSSDRPTHGTRMHIAATF